MSNPFGFGENEPQIKSVATGGDTVATFTTKVKALFTSLFDTLNSYPWSNASQSSAGYMSADDKKKLDCIYYGTCGTAAATAAKVVSCTGFVLETGARVIVKFTTTNTAASPTLNVNSTGAKAIQYRGAAVLKSVLAEGRTYEFVYDGTYWQLVGDVIGGDVLTDTLVFASSVSPLLRAESSVAKDGSISIRYGDYYDGASINFYGRNNSSNPGAFRINATSDGSTAKVLTGKPDGTLTWSGKDIAVVDAVDNTNSGYIRFTNGLQFVWGSATVTSGNESTGIAVTYEKAFTSTPRLFTAINFGSVYGHAYTAQSTDRTSTGCTLIIGSSSGGAADQYANGAVNYLAIGPWA